MLGSKKLVAAKIPGLPAGKYGDGDNLWLHKRSKDSGKWLFYFKVLGRRREMGLGSYPDVSLKDAREAAYKWRSLVREGLDPIKERERERREAERRMHLLKDIAQDAFESRKAELKGDGKAGRWFSPLELHVLPRLGKLPVADVSQIEIRDTLAPIWHEKADTARKAMNRLGICLRHAAALGLDVDLQAVEKARALLGKQRHVPKHVPAMAWQDVPAFFASLDQETPTHLALRLLILTAVRSKPLRFIHQDQIDGDTWIIPGDAMKGRKGATSDFRVPLSGEAQAVLAKAIGRDGFLFGNEKRGVISDATMARHMERLGMEARPHGFRSSFRNWVADRTDTPFEVAEMALGHKVGGMVERAYKRTDYLEQRVVLMQRWADFVTAKAAKVVRIG